MSVIEQEEYDIENDEIEEETDCREKLEKKIRDQAKRLLQSQNYINLCERYISICKPTQTFPLNENDLQTLGDEIQKNITHKEANKKDESDKIREKYALLVNKYKQLSLENERLLETININSNRLETTKNFNRQSFKDKTNENPECTNEKCEHKNETELYRKELIISQVLISELKQEIDNLKKPSIISSDDNSNRLNEYNKLENRRLAETRNENNDIINSFYRSEKLRQIQEEENRKLVKKVNELTSKLQGRKSSSSSLEKDNKKSQDVKEIRNSIHVNNSKGFKKEDQEKYIKDLENDIYTLQKVILDKDVSIKMLEEKLYDQNKNTDLEEENTKLKFEIDRLKSEKQTLISDELNKTLKIIEKQTVDMKQENSNVNSMLTNEIKIKNKEVELFMKEISELKKVITEKTSEIDSLNNKLVIKEYELQLKNDKDKNTFQRKFETMMLEKEELDLEISNKDNKINELKLKCEELQLKLDESDVPKGKSPVYSNKEFHNYNKNEKSNNNNNYNYDKDIINQIDIISKENEELKEALRILNEENEVLKLNEKQLSYDLSDANTIIHEIKLALFSTFSILKLFLQKVYNQIHEDHSRLFSNDITEIISKSLGLSMVLPNEINTVEFIKYLENLTRILLSEISEFFHKLNQMNESEKENLQNSSFLEKIKITNSNEIATLEKKYKEQIRQVQEENNKLQKQCNESKIHYDEKVSEFIKTLQVEKKKYFDELNKISLEFQELNEINTQLHKEKNEKNKIIEQSQFEYNSLEEKNNLLNNQRTFFKNLILNISDKIFHGKSAKLLNAINSVNEEKYQYEIERNNVNIRVKQIVSSLKISTLGENVSNTIQQELENCKGLSNTYTKKIIEYQNLLKKYYNEFFYLHREGGLKDKSSTKATTISSSNLLSNFNSRRANFNDDLHERDSVTSYNSILDTEIISSNDNKLLKTQKKSLDTDFFNKF